MFSFHLNFSQFNRKLIVATLVLLPILGITWILGIFAVDENTTVFAWLFVVVNSLQVMAENVLTL